MSMSARMLTVSRAAARTGVHVKTLQLLDRVGRLPATGRTATGRRWYTETDIDAFFGISQKQKAPDTRPFAYCRVSSAAQKPDLQNQRRVLGDFCAARGLVDVSRVEEVGGGLNFGRPKLLDLMDRVEQGEASHLVVAQRDRLTRFGYPWFERFASRHGCQVLVLNDERLAPEREMVEDLMTIVHCFSDRLYGLRNYKNHLRQSLASHDGSDAP